MQDTCTVKIPKRVLTLCHLEWILWLLGSTSILTLTTLPSAMGSIRECISNTGIRAILGTVLSTTPDLIKAVKDNLNVLRKSTKFDRIMS